MWKKDITIRLRVRVEQSIQTIDNQPVKVSSPCRLPYALRTELEAEVIKLLNTGYIEVSNSPYASCQKEK